MSDASPADPVTITVGVPTYRRNDLLVELLPLLVEQSRDLAADGRYRPRVLIVDNDPLGGAAPVVDGWRSCGVDYAHEPEPGLSAARNRALAASRGSRLIAFMDDDGRPDTGWLSRLVAVWEADRPSAVAGRVVERFEVPPDPWIVAGRFFRRRSLPTHTEVPVAAAGNLLLDLDVLRRLGLTFDSRFGLSGGEDTLLTRRLTQAGERIVWCEESRIVDLVPKDRMTRRWVLGRAFSHGNTWSLVDQAIGPDRSARVRSRVRCAVGGGARVAIGAARAGIGLLSGSLPHQALGLRTAMRGAGLVYGSIGRVVQEYAR
jgi:GT2 family glycosyltransferase